MPTTITEIFRDRETHHRAGRRKQPATLVLVVTDARQPIGLFDVLPADVLVVNSTTTELLERLSDRGIGLPKR